MDKKEGVLKEAPPTPNSGPAEADAQSASGPSSIPKLQEAVAAGDAPATPTSDPSDQAIAIDV